MEILFLIPTPSRERFLTDLTLDLPDATGGQAGVPLKNDDYLILSNIHSAKGQQWRAVFVLNVVDGSIPSDLGSSAEIEEERCLLYVAMTRAKDQLTLGVPPHFYVTQQTRHGDRHIHAMRSRFIAREILDRFEVIHWSPPIMAAIQAAQRADGHRLGDLHWAMTASSPTR